MKKIEPWIKSLIQSQDQPLKVLRKKSHTKLRSNKSWDEISADLNISVERLKKANPKLKNIEQIRKGTIIAYPSKALNVSYTEEGLKWTCNKYGALLYFENGYITKKDSQGKDSYLPRFKGDLSKSSKVIVEDFVPHDHILYGRVNKELQKVEYFWCDKALRLLYTS